MGLPDPLDQATTVLPLPDRQRITVKRDAFLGALPLRNGSELDAAVSLFDDLLEDVEATLPGKVRHLIVVPHGSLEGLPLASLRPHPGAPPVIERYRVSYVPSASLWWVWRTERRAEAGNRVTAFADPRLQATRQWPMQGNVHLPPLPGARREGRRLVRSFGGDGLLLEGHDATEAAVKHADLSGVGFLLFAAHAVVDRRLPRRSAILLAPGGDGEYGLLQPPEIAALRLPGAIIGLSACQSAAGRTIEGEGLISLARAFFRAGGSAVVGNLWPARDDEAARLSSEVYDRLAAGESVAHALQGAQRAAWRANAPSEAWSGVVVIGYGDAYFPGRVGARPLATGRTWWFLAPAIILAWMVWRGIRAYR